MPLQDVESFSHLVTDAGCQVLHLVALNRRFLIETCELFSLLEGPGSLRGGNSRKKMGKNYKISLPGPTPQNGKNPPKRGKITLKIQFFVIFL